MAISAKYMYLTAVVIIAAMIGAAAYHNYDKYGRKEESVYTPDLVARDDTVQVRYVAHLGEQTGPVFDTTDPAVAKDANITKARSFAGTPSSPTIVAGGSSPTRGLAKGLVGLDVNTTVWVQVEPADGFGAYHDGLVVSVPVDQEIPVYQTMDRADFLTLFAADVDEAGLAPGVAAWHPFWGWNITVLGVDERSVEFMNQPELGQPAGSFPWDASVSGISHESVLVAHAAGPSLIGKAVSSSTIKSYDPNIHGNLTNAWNADAVPGSLGTGYVTGYQGTITIDFNLEGAGKTLWYLVTVEKITSG